MEDLFIEIAVFLVGTFRRVLEPKRSGLVDRLLIAFIAFLAFNREENVYRHKRAILVEDLFDLVLLKISRLVFGYVHNNVGSVLVSLTFLDLIFTRAVAYPADRLFVGIGSG